MSSGSVGPVRRLAASLVALGRIRLELLTIELHEEKSRVARLLFWALFAALISGFALIAVAVAVTVALWDSHRLVTLAGVCVVLVTLAVIGWWRVRELISMPTPVLASSVAELRRDEAALRDGPSPTT